MTLIDKIKACTAPNNGLDIAIEIALFEPCEEFGGIRANAAGTKLIYMRHNGTCQTYRAADWTLNNANRNRAIALLESRKDNP